MSTEATWAKAENNFQLRMAMVWIETQKEMWKNVKLFRSSFLLAVSRWMAEWRKAVTIWVSPIESQLFLAVRYRDRLRSLLSASFSPQKLVNQTNSAQQAVQICCILFFRCCLFACCVFLLCPSSSRFTSLASGRQMEASPNKSKVV